MTISIVIVNWNTKDFLNKCLKSIFISSNIAYKLEIIVVDNNSYDGSVEMVEKEFPTVILIRNNENVGFARANNQGIEIAFGKYILLLNPDTVVNTHSLKTMGDFMEQNPEVAACGPKILNGEGEISPVASYPKLLRMISKDTFLAKIFPMMIRSETRFPRKAEMTHNLSGACIMLRRESLNMVGLLNENIFLYYEEPELLERLYKKDWKIYYLPEAKIIHFGEKSTAPLSSTDKLLIDKKSSFELWRSRYGRPRAILLKTIAFILYLISLLSWILRWPFKKERALEKINFYRSLLLLTLGLEKTANLFFCKPLNKKNFNLKQ